MEIQTKKLTVPVLRGMLFLYDHTAKNIEIPVYSKGEIIGSTKTAISIATKSDVDGDTEIILTNSIQEVCETKTKIYSGEIFLTNEAVHLCSMGDVILSQLNQRKGMLKVGIFTDGASFPKSITIVVGDKA